MTVAYCSNEPCEAEAVAVLITDRGTRCPLCHTCREAFEWGQASGVDAVLEDIDQHTDEDEEGIGDRDEEE